MDNKDIRDFKIVSIFSLFVTIGELYQIIHENKTLGVPFSLRSERWLIFILLFGFLFLLVTVILAGFSSENLRIVHFFNRLQGYLKRNTWVSYPFIGLFILLFTFVILGSLNQSFQGFFSRLFLFWFLGIGAAFLIKPLTSMKSCWLAIAISLMSITLIYRLALFTQDISTYPFSLGWSEVSRYYYASLFFSKRLYGFRISPSVLHPTRYLMQSIPFLFSKLPLWFHRLWQVMLWLVFTFWAAIALGRRLSIRKRYQWILFIGWAFFFLLQGPVYYHLLVPVILVLYGFDKRKPTQSLIIVLLASGWAGISRLNWYPVPGMIAATIYFLEKRRGSQSYWKYLSYPALWVGSGFFIALGSQALYVFLSGNEVHQFTSSFSSDLLWYRLFPSATFPLGVLTGTILISLPLFLLWGWAVFSLKRKIDIVRWLGLGGILGILFLGGLVVSVKIGGGSNLHNLDAYLTILLIVGSYLFFNKVALERETHKMELVKPAWISGFIFILPLLFMISQGNARFLPDPSHTKQVLSEIRGLVMDSAKDEGEILFVSQRHLIIFDYIPGVRMVPDYENVFLMEMVMGNNQSYLDAFYQDIKKHRFDLIVIDPLPRKLKSESEPFGEENNVWYERVSLPLLRDYKRVKLYRKVGVEILAPNVSP